MSTLDQLLSTVPGVYLARDPAVALPGHVAPLRALLAAVAEELGELDAAIVQLDDDHFVERASSEALDRIARLVGARLLSDDLATKRGVVARTIGWRRRNGTLATLEEVLSVTTRWSTEVDEAFRSLLVDQDLRFPIPWRGRSVVVWDPIALADPLSRRAPTTTEPSREPRTPLLAPLPGEAIDDTLRRLGRADAGRHAASPRTLDLAGWARPEVVVVRTARIRTFAVSRQALGPGRTLEPRAAGGPRIRVLDLDPLGRRLPLAWSPPRRRPDETGGLTDDHEPAPPEPPGRPVHQLLTPTALAADGDVAEAVGALTLWVDGVPMIGPPPVDPGDGVRTCTGPGPAPVLRFADRGRPAPGEAWRLHLLSVVDPDALDLGPPNTTDPTVDPVALLSARAARGVAEPPAVHLEGRGTAWIRVAREGAGSGFVRGGDGSWSALPVTVADRAPISAAVVVDPGTGPVAVRAVREAGALAIATVPIAGGSWTRVAAAGADLPEIDPNSVGPDLGLCASGTDLVLVGVRTEPAPDGTGDRLQQLGAWRVDLTGTTARLDDPSASPRIPPGRAHPSAVVHDGRVYVFGGLDGEVPLGDLWSVSLAGGRWQNHRARGAVPRAGATLLSTPAGLVLIGGATTPGVLSATVLQCDPSRRRPVWRELPPLPLPPGPGTLTARALGGDLEVVAWADRTAPVRLRLPAGAEAWTVGPVEAGAPNPPAEGEAVWSGDALVILGPSPLPPSEVIASLDGDGAIAFLPALDLPFDGDAALFELQRDGSTRRWVADGEARPQTYRLGLARAESWPIRTAPAPRFGVTGRLAWAPMRLRQANLEPLGPTATVSALVLEGEVALDPRLGRIALRDDLVPGPGQGLGLAASFVGARSAAIGAGLVPWDREPAEGWREADRPLPALPGGADVWVSTRPQPGAPTVPTVAEALGGAPVRIAIRDSIRSAPLHLPAPPGVTALSSAGDGGVPSFSADGSGVSIRVDPVFDDDPDRVPTVHLTGLVLEGRLHVGISRGVLDLRWCNVGLAATDFVPPGPLAPTPGIRVAGGGHTSALGRRSLPEATLTLFLTGCLVGRLEIPPWVQVVAAGCTFDGGADGTAIAGAGGRARLRHCTVHGAVSLGLLEASSCAFTGPIVVDRPDLGWLRYSVLAEGGRPPVRFACIEAPLSLQSLHPLDPTYLLLADNNPEAVLTAGEGGRIPGAHGDRTDGQRELEARSGDHVPMGLVPYPIDRAVADLARMSRRRA